MSEHLASIQLNNCIIERRELAKELKNKNSVIEKLKAELDKAKSEVKIGNTIIEQLQRSTKVLVQTLEAHAAKQSEALKVLKDMGAFYANDVDNCLCTTADAKKAREALSKCDEILGVKK